MGFQKFMRRFFTYKDFIGNNDVTLIRENKMISDGEPLIKLLNNCCRNIFEKSSATKPKTFGTNLENTSRKSVRDIVNS